MAMVLSSCVRPGSTVVDNAASRAIGAMNDRFRHFSGEYCGRPLAHLVPQPCMLNQGILHSNLVPPIGSVYAGCQMGTAEAPQIPDVNAVHKGAQVKLR